MPLQHICLIQHWSQVSASIWPPYPALSSHSKAHLARYTLHPTATYSQNIKQIETKRWEQMCIIITAPSKNALLQGPIGDTCNTCMSSLSFFGEQLCNHYLLQSNHNCALAIGHQTTTESNKRTTFSVWIVSNFKQWTPYSVLTISNSIDTRPSWLLKLAISVILNLLDTTI